MNDPRRNDGEETPLDAAGEEGITTWAVDSQGRIDSVGGLWVSFARANQGEDTLPPGILGRSILDFISPTGAREMVRYLMETVHRVGTPLQVPYRCDSPAEVRKFELTIHPRPDGGTRFESRIREVVARDRPLEILNPSVERADKRLTLCAWCKAVEDPEESGRWSPLDTAVRALNLLDPPFPQLSHGLCPSCHDALLAEPGGASFSTAQP